jgi:hypothetical protein
VIATWVCIRGLPAKVPARTALQLAQAQFHCGNAPPAAEPRIFTFISASLQLGVSAARNSWGAPCCDPGMTELATFQKLKRANMKTLATQISIMTSFLLSSCADGTITAYCERPVP